MKLAAIKPELLVFRLAEIISLERPLACCNTKVVYIQAKNDKLMSSNVVELFRNVFVDFEMITIDSGHFVLQAQPCACAQIVLQTIKGV